MIERIHNWLQWLGKCTCGSFSCHRQNSRQKSAKRSEKGQALVEYAALLSIVVAGAAGLALLFHKIVAMLGATGAKSLF